MYVGKRVESTGSNLGRSTGNNILQMRTRRGPTRPENRKPATPKHPGKVITTEDLRVARMYYEHELIATQTNNAAGLGLSREELNKMTKPQKAFYERIKKYRKDLGHRLGEAEDENTADGLPLEDAELVDIAMTNLLNKVSRIKTGRNLGSSWTIKDQKNFEELRISKRFETLLYDYVEIMPIIEHCWSIDREALSKLDQNPWGKDPISYIDELLSSLDHPSRNPASPLSSSHPCQQ